MNSTSKSKHKGKAGSALSRSQTGTATTTASGADSGFDSVKSAAAANNLGELASSSESPDPSLLSSGDAMGDAFLFSSPGSGVISDGVRSLVTSLHHTGAEHPPVSPSDLQANRESPMFYLHPQGPPHTVFPSSHLPVSVDPAVRFQQSPLGTAAASDPYLTLPSPSSPFRHGGGTAAASPRGTAAHVAAQSLSSRGPHTSFPAGTGLLQTRHSHLDLVSEALALSPIYTVIGHPLHNLDPTATAAAAAVAHTHGTVGPSVGPDLVTPPLGPSTAPIPSMYWLLFDMDCDSIDRTRDGDVSSLSPPKLPSCDVADATSVTATTLPVTPTPISFLAKWEDMLALERRIRSSSSSSYDKHNQNAEADLSPPLSEQLEYPEVPQAQAQTQTQTQTRSHAQDQAVKMNRTELDDRELCMRS
jgi:hypothetical protein